MRARGRTILLKLAVLLPLGVGLGPGGGVSQAADSLPAQVQAEAPVQAIPAPPAVGPWEIVRSDHGIVVMRRTVAGSPLHEFQGTGLVEAPVATVLAVLDDTEHRTEWMKESHSQKLIEKSDERTVIFYNRTAAPWPVADRDVVMRASSSVDLKEKLLRIEFTSVEHPHWPPQKGVVRVPLLRGHWHLWPVSGGKYTRAEYQVFVNPGGMLPDWLINLASKKIPYDTIRALQGQVKRRQYPELERKILASPDYQALIAAAMGPAAPVAPSEAAVVGAGAGAAAAPAAGPASSTAANP